MLNLSPVLKNNGSLTERVKKSKKIVQIQEDQCMTERLKPKARDADTSFKPELEKAWRLGKKETEKENLRINISQLHNKEVVSLSMGKNATVLEVKEKLRQQTQVEDVDRFKLIYK